VGYKDGKEIMSREVKTAGEPAAIVLSADRTEIRADGSDLSFITVTVVDSDNIPVPHADNLIKFDVSGEGSIAGVDNGLQTSMESFKADHRKAFNGKCLLVVRAGKEDGNINVSAASDGLTSAVTVIRVR
jgi:beta-galactosidase